MTFVDAGYVTGGARQLLGLKGVVKLNPRELEVWAEHAYGGGGSGSNDMLRCYVYDGAYPSTDPNSAEQRAYHDLLGRHRSIRLRLGRLVERKAGTSRAFYQQKGVDTLLVLDLVRMAQQQAFDIAVIVTGDSDIAEALAVVADDYGRRVVLYGVEGSDPSSDLLRVADEHGTIDRRTLEWLVAEQDRWAQRRPDPAARPQQ